MPIYNVDCRGNLEKRSFERSPAIALETNADSADDVPSAVQSAVDATTVGSLSGFLCHEVPHRMDGVLTWLAGDSLLTGTAAAIRHDLQVPGRCVFVPVHIPGVDGIPFITVQPRWFRAGRRHDYWNFNIRLQGLAAATPQLVQALQANAQPWAQLSSAVLAEQASPGGGVESLVHLHENSKQCAKIFGALILRNLAVMMLRHSEPAKAEKVLTLGMQTYPGYPELPYLAAVLAWRDKRSSQALALVEKTKREKQAFSAAVGKAPIARTGCWAASPPVLGMNALPSRTFLVA